MIRVPYPWVMMALRRGGIIAGGALRDLILNRMPPKDVDIFVPGLHEGECSEDFEAYANGYFTVNNIDLQGTRYQVIKHRFGDGKWAALDRFDIGLCKVAYCPIEGWHFTSDFVKDMANRTITELNVDHFNHEGHMESVKARYPDFTVVPYKSALDEVYDF